MPTRPDDRGFAASAAPSWARATPLALTGLRAALAPIVVLLAWDVADPGPWFAACLVVAFLSDVFDGIVARRLGIATPGLRRLDSAADTLFYLACVAAAWHLHRSALVDRWIALALLAGVEALRHVVDFLKFGREASYHMWSSKVWGIALFAGFFGLLVLAVDGLLVSLAIGIGIVADLEGLLVSTLLPTWRADVPSFVHAWRLRQASRPSTGITPS